MAYRLWQGSQRLGAGMETGRLMMRLLQQFGGKRAVGLNQGERGSKNEYWEVLDPSIGGATGIC